MIVTIDGPAGAGKGTVAKYLAEKYHFKKLDTGLLYRALAKQVLDKKWDIENDKEQIIRMAKEISISATQQEGLRTEQVANFASLIAVIPEVRAILAQLQREFAHADPFPYKGVILDGRDIGTVICPEAECKIFLTASAEVRAQRRHQQTLVKKETLKHEITTIMRERDTRDQQRTIAPLSPAENACIIDTTQLTIEEVCSRAAYYIDQFYLKQCKN